MWGTLVAAWLWAAGATAAEPPATVPASAWSLDARADQLLARMGQSEGDARRQLALARGARDSARAQCVTAKLAEIASNVGRARRTRASLRRAMIYDETSAVQAAWASMLELDRAAREQASQAAQCRGAAGGETGDRDADGIPDSVDRSPEEVNGLEDTDGAPEPSRGPVFKLRERALEARVDALKEKIWSSHSRLLLAPGGAPAAAAATAAAPAVTGPHDASKIIRTADVTLAVYHVDRALSSVDAIARELGGYLSLRTDQQVTIRVPRERFDDAMLRVEKLGDVLHRSVTAEDVTDEYVDLDMRLRNALVVRARLEKLLETAAVRDAVEIEKELARVTEEIERIEGKLKLLSDRIAYSSITVSFEPSAPQQIRSRALLPFPWMNDVGLSPLLALPGGRK